MCNVRHMLIIIQAYLIFFTHELKARYADGLSNGLKSNFKENGIKLFCSFYIKFGKGTIMFCMILGYVVLFIQFNNY